MKTILQQIQDETKVEWKEIFDGFVVSGTFDQINAVNELVKNKLTEKKHGKNVFSPSLSRHVSRCDKASPAPPVMTPSPETFRKTRDQSYETTSTSSSQVDNQLSANELMPKTQVIDGCVQSSQLSLNPDDVLQSVLEKCHCNEPQTFKKVKSDASDKYSTLNSIPTSETVTDSKTKPMGIRDTSSLSGAVFSDANVPMKKAAKKTDQSYETTSTSSSQGENQSSANELMPETQVIDGCVQSSRLSLNPDDVLQSVLEKCHSNEPQTLKKVKSGASDKYSTLNGTPTSETVTDSKTKPMAIRDTSSLSGAVSSDANVPMKEAAKKTQQEEKTKEHCRLTTLETSSGKIKGKKDASTTPQLDYEIGEERKSYACDLQAEAEEFHAIKTENESDSTPPVGMEENAEQSQNLERDTTSNVISNTNQELGVTRKGTYMFDTVTGLRVWLTKGDITSQQDDILLSPIDPSLSFKSDFLKRMVKKGGEGIKREYLHKKEAHANPHDSVITSGGNLPCQAIVFAVLPPWNNEVQDKKKRKQQIHRRLKEAIILASGCKYKSMALPLLGQDGNDIQDSAEIIVRVIASFGKNIDPMHSGFNEFRIVCKDEASLAVVLNEFSSFSFHPGQLFFVNRSWSINNLVQAEETDLTLASQNSQRNKPEMHDPSSEKVSSMDPHKESSSRNKTSTNKTTVDHIDEPQASSKSSEVTVEKEKGAPLQSISPSCQVDSASHHDHIDWDTKHEAEEDGNPNDVKHSKETTIGNVSSSSGKYTTSSSQVKNQPSAYELMPETQVIDGCVQSSRLSFNADNFLQSVLEKYHNNEPQTFKKAKSDASDKYSTLNGIPTSATVTDSETKPMAIRDTSSLSGAVFSDANVPMKEATKKTQQEEKTKERCRLTTLGTSSEQIKGKKDASTTPQLDYEIDEERKSYACDLQAEAEEFHAIKTENESDSTPPVGMEENAEQSQNLERDTTSNVISNTNQELGVTRKGTYMFDTVTGLRVWLTKGDITSQQDDILLSPIDPSLSFKSDFLKRIVRKGGEAIKREYLLKKEAHAPPHDPIITGGGNLPCRAIVFAVLPPWNNEVHDKKKCKQQIHKRLKEAITLASGYRHKSVAFPLLGQDYNDIPVEVSAEVIVRVIASFGKNLGPMHSGINEFRIVCEDEASFAAVVNQISSFSFSSGQPFFVSGSSNSTSPAHAEETARNEASINEMSLTKVISVNQDQKAPRITENSPKKNTTVDQVDEVHVVSQVSASKSSEVTGEKEKVPSGYPLSFVHPSCQYQSTSHQNHESKEDGTPNNEKLVNEMAICHVPSSSVDCVKISVRRASEIVQVTSVTQRVEEKIKSITLQDRPHLAFVADHALNLREKEVRTGISKIEEKTVGTTVTQEVTIVDRDPQHKSSLPGRNQEERTEETEKNRNLSTTITDTKIQALDKNSQEESASSFHIQPKVTKQSTALYNKVNQTEVGNSSEEKRRSNKGKTVYPPSRPVPGIGNKELKEKGDLVWKDECVEIKKGDKRLNGEASGSELNGNIFFSFLICNNIYSALSFSNIVFIKQWCYLLNALYLKQLQQLKYFTTYYSLSNIVSQYCILHLCRFRTTSFHSMCPLPRLSRPPRTYRSKYLHEAQVLRRLYHQGFHFQ